MPNPAPTRVLVCGGRDFSDYHLLARTLYELKPAAIIVGDASGADHHASVWAFRTNCPWEVYRADWQQYGKAAGPIRNQLMLDEGKPDLVVAFPGGRGTADMVRRARAAGVEVREIGDG